MRSRRATRLLIVILFGIMALVCIILWPHDRSLLKRSIRFMEMPEGSYYDWVSDHEILVFRKVNGKYALSIFDMNSRRSMPSPRLQAIFNTNLFAVAPNDEFYPQVSADGKRLMWQIEEQGGGTTAHYWCCWAKLDGSEASKARIGADRAFNNRAPNVCYWLPDGQHWAEALRPDKGDTLTFDRLCIHSFDRPNDNRIITLPRAPYDREIRDDNIQFSADRLLVVQNTNDPSRPDTDVIDEYRFGIRTEWVKRYVAPRIPHFDRTYAFAYVPSRGNSVCWQVGVDEPVSPLLTFLHRFMPRISAGTSKWTGIYIADLNGDRMREAGMMPYSEVGDEEPIGWVCWAPDQRYISYVYNGWLYTFAVADAARVGSVGAVD